MNKETTPTSAFLVLSSELFRWALLDEHFEQPAGGGSCCFPCADRLRSHETEMVYSRSPEVEGGCVLSRWLD